MQGRGKTSLLKNTRFILENKNVVTLQLKNMETIALNLIIEKPVEGHIKTLMLSTVSLRW